MVLAELVHMVFGGGSTARFLLWDRTGPDRVGIRDVAAFWALEPPETRAPRWDVASENISHAEPVAAHMLDEKISDPRSV